MASRYDASSGDTAATATSTFTATASPVGAAVDVRRVALVSVPPHLPLVQRVTVQERYDDAPPIVQAAIKAILDLEDRIDPMGYDLAYYQQDLPDVVTEAIAGWKGM